LLKSVNDLIRERAQANKAINNYQASGMKHNNSSIKNSSLIKRDFKRLEPQSPGFFGEKEIKISYKDQAKVSFAISAG
jgi:hypothetical protein